MPISKRYLTKSRFKIGTECPTKLYFTGKPEYGSNKVDNSFLEALAQGGFQVGALAKLYYPEGKEITALNTAEALAQTQELLKQDRVTLFEPAIAFENLIVRVDILRKSGNFIELFEVKAKSIDPAEDHPFFTKTSVKKGKPELNSDWKPYILDIAFQTYVVKKAFPDCKVSSYLMLANKAGKAAIDGANQRFYLRVEEGNRTVIDLTPGTTNEMLGTELLTRICVDDAVDIALASPLHTQTFPDFVSNLAKAYEGDELVPPKSWDGCKNCEFRISADKKAKGQKSGFEECWTRAHHFKPEDFNKPLILDVWNLRGAGKYISSKEKLFFMDQLKEEDFVPKKSENEEPGLSQSERQWLQITKAIQKDYSPELDRQNLANEMATWKFPLNFIDFETTMVAIPFNQGRRPYEQTAFQFSHHTVSADGKIRHENEYINQTRGHFPNFDFVRNLKAALAQNQGTIFRFADHENTVLRQIHDQLSRSNEQDRHELMGWIKTITQPPKDAKDEKSGERNMVDMCKLVKRFFYHPYTEGSNSIKDVLPAVLKESKYLQEKYSKAIYGSNGGPVSRNYKDWQWIQKDPQGNIIDPYKLLPEVFSDLTVEEMDRFVLQDPEDAIIPDGGAAMIAYARMQFMQMSDAERERITKALLRYCELDTFAMVLIYEYWLSEVAPYLPD